MYPRCPPKPQLETFDLDAAAERRKKSVRIHPSRVFRWAGRSNGFSSVDHNEGGGLKLVRNKREDNKKRCSFEPSKIRAGNELLAATHHFFLCIPCSHAMHPCLER